MSVIDRLREAISPSSPAPEAVNQPVQYVREHLKEDFRRNSRASQRFTLILLRSGRAWHKQPGLRAFIVRRVIQRLKFLWFECVIGGEIPNEVTIGPGLRIPHNVRGVMMHPTASMGRNVTLYHQTVLGVRDERAAPRVGDNVEIGAGAKLLGPITVGDGCSIGANAVVVKDTEPGGTYVGIPATRVVSRAKRPA